MQDWMIILNGGLALMPIMLIPAALLIGVEVYKLIKLGKQFVDCDMRKGIVQEMGVREATQQRPYRHCFVRCSFQGDSVEIPYSGGDLKHTQVGDEIPVYFYTNGTTSVVAYDEHTVKVKIRKQVIFIIIFCIIMAFIIPAAGVVAAKKFGS